MCNMAFADGNGVVVTARSSDDCQVTPVIHVLQYPGCVPKPIPSFACTGRCSSYLQVKQFYEQYTYLYHISSENCYLKGFWIKNMANGKVLHVLPRKW